MNLVETINKILNRKRTFHGTLRKIHNINPFLSVLELEVEPDKKYNDSKNDYVQLIFYSFVSPSYLNKKVSIKIEKQGFFKRRINQSISTNLSIYRVSLSESLIKNVKKNLAEYLVEYALNRLNFERGSD